MSAENKFELARVCWKLGQPLFPEHLLAQEKSLLANMIERYKAVRGPSWGILELEYDTSQIYSGTLKFINLSVILNSGILLKLGGNMFLSPKNLLLSGKETCSVHCHVLQEDSSKVEPWCDNKKKVEKNFYRVVLSKGEINQKQPIEVRKELEHIETFKLAVFERQQASKWKLSSNFVPPLAIVGQSPFLAKPMEQLRDVLDRFFVILQLMWNDTKSYPLYDCIKSVHATICFLENVDKGIAISTYDLYRVLYDLCVSIRMYKGRFPDREILSYDHENPKQWFDPLYNNILDQLSGHKVVVSKSKFELNDGIYTTNMLSGESKIEEVFLAVEQRLDPEGIPKIPPKVGAKSDIEILFKHALTGIKTKKIIPNFDHDLHPESLFFIMEKDLQFRKAVKEKAFSFYAQKEYEKFNFYLFYSMKGEV